MTNSEMFKKAHQIARETVEVVGNYSIAFKLALKQVWAYAKAVEKKDITYSQMATMGNSLIFGAKSQGYNSNVLAVAPSERDAAEKALRHYWLDDELTEEQYDYAIWCYLIGQKWVDRWLKVMW